MARRRQPVDSVAIILACALAATVLLIFAATVVQILNNSFPEVTLSENATQVLIGGIGGLTALLGAYLGMRTRQDEDDDDDKPPS